MSSTARVKRPFAGAAADPSQRQITSFFGAQSGAPAAETARQQPALPANVQSNLLSVGMRVRKSVPEGYKTDGHSAFKLWTDNTTPNAPKVRGSTRVASRELLPFCGINKVGGFESQPAFAAHDDVPDEDAVPELTMSQETADGNETATPSRKRIYDDDEDAQQLNGELSPGNRGNARLLAVPHSRIKKGTVYRNAGQENRMVDQDFEEAEFLVFDDEQDLNMVI
ncbi:hypothetical protein MY11210_001520 [Beauveria gryllotalpidicola]